MKEELKNKAMELSDEDAAKAAGGDFPVGVYFTCDKCGKSVMAYLSDSNTLTCPNCGYSFVFSPSGPK